jgi:hypothetical protein
MTTLSRLLLSHCRSGTGYRRASSPDLRAGLGRTTWECISSGNSNQTSGRRGRSRKKANRCIRVQRAFCSPAEPTRLAPSCTGSGGVTQAPRLDIGSISLVVPEMLTYPSNETNLSCYAQHMVFYHSSNSMFEDQHV